VEGNIGKNTEGEYKKVCWRGTWGSMLEGNIGKYTGEEYMEVSRRGIEGSTLEGNTVNYTGGYHGEVHWRRKIAAQVDVRGIFMGGYFMIFSATIL
jgi:hypothetical protein